MMNFKWFRMLFAPLNDNLKQIYLRRTAPQSKSIAKVFKPVRFLSRLQPNSKMDLLRSNADVLESITQKTTFGVLGGLSRLGSEPVLRLNSMARSRPSSRCFIKSGGSASRRSLRNFYLQSGGGGGGSSSKLSKKISHMERFHLNRSCGERLGGALGLRAAGSDLATTNALLRGDMDRGVLGASRPVARRAGTRGLASWKAPILPVPGVAQKDAQIPVGRANVDPSKNIRMVRSIIQRAKAEFSSKCKGLAEATPPPPPRRRFCEGWAVADAPPCAKTFSNVLQASARNTHSAIGLRRSSKHYNLASGSTRRQQKDLHAGKPRRARDPPIWSTTSVNGQKSAARSLPSISGGSGGSVRSAKSQASVAADSDQVSDGKSGNFYLVRNPTSGKLDVIQRGSSHFNKLVQGIPRIAPPEELCERTFKEKYLSGFTPAQSYVDYKSNNNKHRRVNQGRKDGGVGSCPGAGSARAEEEHAMPATTLPKWLKMPARLMMASEQPALVWKRSPRKPVPDEPRAQGHPKEAAGWDDLKTARAACALEVKRDAPNLSYGHFGNAEYMSFCDIAKTKNLFEFIPRTKPRLKITYPTHTVSPVLVGGRALKNSRGLSSLRNHTQRDERREDEGSANVTAAGGNSGDGGRAPATAGVASSDSRSGSGGSGGSAGSGGSPSNQGWPNSTGIMGILNKMHHTQSRTMMMGAPIVEAPARHARRIRAHAGHRPKSKRGKLLSATHNIKKPSMANLEYLFKNRLRQRGLRSYRVSQDKDFEADLLMDAASEFEASQETTQSSHSRGQRGGDLPMLANAKVELGRLRLPAQIKPCKACGLIHSLAAQGRCPLAEFVKTTEPGIHPHLNTSLKRYYTTKASAKTGVYPSNEEEELLHVCRYCGLVHTHPGQICPMNEALKLFVAGEKRRPPFRLVQPKRLTAVPNIPPKEVMLKRIDKLDRRLRTLKVVKQNHVAAKDRHQGDADAKPPRVLFRKPMVSSWAKKTALQPTMKQYDKFKMSATWKSVYRARQLKESELIKFSKVFGGMVKDLMNGEDASKLQLKTGAQCQPSSNHRLRIKLLDIHDGTASSVNLVRGTTPTNSKEQLYANATRSLHDSKKLRCRCDTACRRIPSTKNNSITGSRHFNTSCAHHSSKKMTNARGVKRSSKNLSEHAQKYVKVTGYGKCSMPNIAEAWSRYKQQRMVTLKQGQVPAESVVRDKRMQECIDTLRGQVGRALRSVCTEPCVRDEKAPHRLLSITMDTLSNDAVARARSDIIIRRGTATASTSKEGRRVEDPTARMRMRLRDAADRPETKVIKVLLKEEPYSTDGDVPRNAVNGFGGERLSRGYSTKSVSSNRPSKVQEFLKKGKQVAAPVKKEVPVRKSATVSADKCKSSSCPPPCGPRPAADAHCNRKLCNDANLRDTITKLMRVGHPCEIDLVQERIRKAKARAASEEDEFFKYYKCDAHRTRAFEVCAADFRQNACGEDVCSATAVRWKRAEPSDGADECRDGKVNVCGLKEYRSSDASACRGNTELLQDCLQGPEKGKAAEKCGYNEVHKERTQFKGRSKVLEREADLEELCKDLLRAKPKEKLKEKGQIQCKAEPRRVYAEEWDDCSANGRDEEQDLRQAIKAKKKMDKVFKEGRCKDVARVQSKSAVNLARDKVSDYGSSSCPPPSQPRKETARDSKTMRAKEAIKEMKRESQSKKFQEAQWAKPFREKIFKPDTCAPLHYLSQKPKLEARKVNTSAKQAKEKIFDADECMNCQPKKERRKSSNGSSGVKPDKIFDKDSCLSRSADHRELKSPDFSSCNRKKYQVGKPSTEDSVELISVDYRTPAMKEAERRLQMNVCKNMRAMAMDPICQPDSEEPVRCKEDARETKTDEIFDTVRCKDRSEKKKGHDDRDKEEDGEDAFESKVRLAEDKYCYDMEKEMVDQDNDLVVHDIEEFQRDAELVVRFKDKREKTTTKTGAETKNFEESEDEDILEKPSKEKAAAVLKCESEKVDADEEEDEPVKRAPKASRPAGRIASKVVPVCSCRLNYVDPEDVDEEAKEDVRNELPRSMHLCCTEDMLRKRREEYMKCKKSLPDPSDHKARESKRHKGEKGEEEEEREEEGRDGDREESKSMRCYSSTRPRVSFTSAPSQQDQYHFEPIRSARHRYVEREIKKLNEYEKGILQASRVPAKVAYLNPKPSVASPGTADSASIISTCTLHSLGKGQGQEESMRDIRRSLDADVCPQQVMHLPTTADIIAERIFYELFSKNQPKHVEEPKGADECVKTRCRPKEPEVEYARVSKEQMEEICQKVLQQIAAIRGEEAEREKIVLEPVPTKAEESHEPPGVKSSRLLEASSLDKVRPKDTALVKIEEEQGKVMVGEASSSTIDNAAGAPRWKYLDSVPYDYNHYEKCDKSGSQIYRCMQEVKRCLDNYKKCLIDLNLIPHMDKHFDYDSFETSSISMPNLPDGCQGETEELEQSLLTASSSTRGLTAGPGRCAEQKYSSKLNTVPLLMSGPHPLSLKPKQSTTSVFSQKSHAHTMSPSSEAAFFDRLPNVVETVGAIFMTPTPKECDDASVTNGSIVNTQRKSNGVPDKRRGFHRVSASDPSSANLPAVKPDGGSVEEVTVYFPRGERTINVELLFDANGRTTGRCLNMPRKMSAPAKPMEEEEGASERSFKLPSFPDDAHRPPPTSELKRTSSLALQQGYDYTKLPACHKDEQPRKPIQVFEQICEVTTSKLRQMSSAVVAESAACSKTVSSLFSDSDELWPIESYPKAHPPAPASSPAAVTTTSKRRPGPKNSVRSLSQGVHIGPHHQFTVRDAHSSHRRDYPAHAHAHRHEHDHHSGRASYAGYEYNYRCNRKAEDEVPSDSEEQCKCLGSHRSLPNIIREACADIRRSAVQAREDLRYAFGVGPKHPPR